MKKTTVSRWSDELRPLDFSSNVDTLFINLPVTTKSRTHLSQNHASRITNLLPITKVLGLYSYLFSFLVA